MLLNAIRLWIPNASTAIGYLGRLIGQPPTTEYSRFGPEAAGQLHQCQVMPFDYLNGQAFPGYFRIYRYPGTSYSNTPEPTSLS